MCKVLKVPRSSYYRWLKDPEGARKRKYMELDEKIRDAYFAAKGRNGSPRLAKDLQVSGTPVSRTTVACHMREMGLRSKLSRRFKVTTDASHNYKVAPNLLNREFNHKEPVKACVSDLTYTVVPAIRMANRNRPSGEGLIFHSDRGIQYACKQTVNLLKSLKLEQSMSGKGNCWDNAVAESFFKTFKSELVYGTKLKTREQMRLHVFEYIETWYNHKRRFSALGNLTIDEFWNQYNLKKESIKNVA
ncbi:IS3 family transposase [Dysgonomonadaceae bacterium zrk40]|nr:IS3 family transposase [Dysgonomonadaceae bacterium zrk40]